MSGQAPQIDQVGGSGEQTQDARGGGLGVVDPQFTMMRNIMRDRIFEYVARKQFSTDYERLRVSELAKRLEDIMYSMFPTKREYYYMMRGPVEPQLQIAIRRLVSAQNQQNQQMPMQMASSSSYGTTIPTAGITQDATGNSRMRSATDDAGLPSSGASATLVTQNVEIRTSLPGCHPYIAMDSTHSTERSRGHLASAITIDDHNWLFLVAYGMIETESKESWTWIIHNLNQATCTPTGSDIGEGIEGTVDHVYPVVEH